jgi:hypothetical protein
MMLPVGAGAAISEGIKMRALTAKSAIKNTTTIANGATYCRKIFISQFHADVPSRSKLLRIGWF